MLSRSAASSFIRADTIAAIATASGYGAIAIVRASGPGAARLAERLFKGKRALEPQRLLHGDILDERGELIDRGVAVFAKAPHSYTGEDTVEFHVHGSPVVAAETLRAMIASGARLAGPGEFTLRALLYGKMDWHAASSVADLIGSEHRSAARAAAANIGGALASEVRRIRARLASGLEQLAASIDYPDEVAEPDRATLATELAQIGAALEQLLCEAEIGRLVRDGLDVAIVGPPNAGKSSLLNALLGEERAIVAETAGTTRDTIEESIAIDGVRVRLTDTAGLREGTQAVESAGIARTKRALEAARLLIVVIDGSIALGPEAMAVLAETQDRPRIILFNKADLGAPALSQTTLPDILSGSVRDRETIDALRRSIARCGWNAVAPDLQRPRLASLRETDAVARALQSLAHARGTLESGMPSDLAAADLQEAFAALGHLTGESVTEEMLTAIFSRFCIGK